MASELKKLDGVLSGVIILLLILVVWKWYSKPVDCAASSMALNCVCRPGECRCRGMTRMRSARGCAGGDDCCCGHPAGGCTCPSSCHCNESMIEVANLKESFGEGNVTGTGPQLLPGSALAQDATSYMGALTGTGVPGDDYADTIQDMSLEPEVASSHRNYCNSLSFAGLPTGASACTTLEETGRSYGTADFVGLTSRKFCKARQLATPASDARVTPTQNIVEWCDIEMDELV
jgi:hypothetical protein